MQNYCKTIGALAAVSALVAGNAMAEVEYELHTGYTSEYLFRGLNLGQDLIEVGADVKAEMNGFLLSAGAWYGMVDNAQNNTYGMVNSPSNSVPPNLVSVNDPVSFRELDLYAEAGRDFGWATASIGYISRQYDLDGVASIPQVDVNGYERDLDSEQEVYFTLARKFWDINTSLTYYWSIEGPNNNGYSELAMSKTWELNPCVFLNAGGDLGYLVEEGEFTALTLKTSLDWGFAGTAKLSPFMAYSLSLTDSDDYYTNAKNQFVGGMMLSVGF